MSKDTPKRRRILVVDDHPIVRKGLIQLIDHQPDMTVSDEAENAYQALGIISNACPDLALVDITLKGVNGIKLIEDIARKYPQLPVLVVSMHDESLYAERSFRAGAQGYIMKQEDDVTLLAAIRQVLDGGVWVSERMTKSLVLTFANKGDAERSPIDLLTNRELEVFGLIGQGLETREIADILCRSVKTIETHRGRIKRKLNVRNNAQLVQKAVAWTLRETAS